MGQVHHARELPDVAHQRVERRARHLARALATAGEQPFQHAERRRRVAPPDGVGQLVDAGVQGWRADFVDVVGGDRPAQRVGGELGQLGLQKIGIRAHLGHQIAGFGRTQAGAARPGLLAHPLGDVGLPFGQVVAQHLAALLEQLRQTFCLAERLPHQGQTDTGHRVAQVVGDTVAVGRLPGVGGDHDEQAGAEREGGGVGRLEHVGGGVDAPVELADVEVAGRLVEDALAQARRAAAHLGLVGAADEVGGLEVGELVHVSPLI